jgi:ABC-type amino acid transport substrate-binding protein
MPREYRQTEKRLRAVFWQDIAPGIPRNDKPALREAFHNWKDSLHRDGELTDYQADKITLNG